jgi:hypothetical protein
VHAEVREQVDEDLGVVAGVGVVPVGLLVRDVREGPPHLAIDRIGREERLGIHRVEVVDAVQERGRVAGGAQRADDHVEDDRAAEAPHVDGPGRGLGVVDDLRSGDLCRELVSPFHGCAPAYEMATIV